MKDLPPAGRERDKVIAKLKGYFVKWDEFYKSEDKWFMLKSMDEEEQYPAQSWNLKNWSTSRSDTMELWDEIKCYAKQITEYVNGMTWVHCFKDEKEAMNRDGFIWINGKDIPDAVSKAWIIWKK